MRELAIARHMIEDDMTFEEVALRVGVARGRLEQHLTRLREHYAQLHEAGQIEDAGYETIRERLNR